MIFKFYLLSYSNIHNYVNTNLPIYCYFPAHILNINPFLHLQANLSILIVVKEAMWILQK